MGYRSRFALILMLTLAVGSCVWPARFEGISMRPTIDDGNRILITNDVSSIDRGDILLFRYPVDPEKSYMKRVIGLPGESLHIDDGTVYIDSQRLEEPYVDSRNNQLKESVPAVAIPADHYFVMGDNRDNSSDSRAWGTVDKALIEGELYSTY